MGALYLPCIILYPSFHQFQKFLSLSRPVLECKSPALEQPKGLWSLSSGGSVTEAGKVSRESWRSGSGVAMPPVQLGESVTKWWELT